MAKTGLWPAGHPPQADIRHRDYDITRQEKEEEKRGPLLLTKQSHFYVTGQRLSVFSKPFQSQSKAIRIGET